MSDETDRMTPTPKAAYTDRDNRPVVLPVVPGGIPAALTALPRWTLWAMEWATDKQGDGKWTKVPYRINGRWRAKNNDATTWGEFAPALAAYRDDPERWAGVGVMLGGGLTGIDCDGVRDAATGRLLAGWAAGLVVASGTYADVSPSGTGVKLFGLGSWSGKWFKRPHPSGAGEIEVYAERRFFTVTGIRQGVGS